MFNPFKWRPMAQEPPPGSLDTDSYLEKLLRYVPADIIAAYVALDGILRENHDGPLWLSWAVFLALLFLTPFYVCYKKTEPSTGFHSSKMFHWLASTVAFAVWVFALGGPFAVTFSWYQPVYGSVLLILTSLAIPVFEALVYNAEHGNAPTDRPPTITEEREDGTEQKGE